MDRPSAKDASSDQDPEGNRAENYGARGDGDFDAEMSENSTKYEHKGTKSSAQNELY